MLILCVCWVQATIERFSFYFKIFNDEGIEIYMLKGNKTKDLRNGSHVIIKNGVGESSWCWGRFKKLEGKWGSHINLLTFSINQLQERRQHDCLSCDF